MKSNIKYSVFGFLVLLICSMIGVIALAVLITDNSGGNEWGILGYSIFLIIAVLMLLHSIKNIQWYDIGNGHITVYCPFGAVKKVGLPQIINAFKTNATIYSIKMLAVRRPHIVLCLQKSVAKADVDSAYNGKKKPYIIIPYSKEAEDLICAEYKKLCGVDLVIHHG